MNKNLYVQANLVNKEEGIAVPDVMHSTVNYKSGSIELDVSQALQGVSVLERATRIASFSRLSDWGLDNATATLADIVKWIPSDSTMRVESYTSSIPNFENPTIAGQRQTGTLEVTGAADSNARTEFTFNNHNAIWRRYVTTSYPAGNPQADSGWLMMSSRGAQVEIEAAMVTSLSGLLSNLRTPGEYSINGTNMGACTDNPFTAFSVSPSLSLFYVERAMRNRGIIQYCQSLINNAEFRRYILADGTVGSWAMIATSGREFLSTAAMNFAGGVMSGHVSPNNNAAWNLGGASTRWNNIYLANNPNVSSDARLKEDIEDISDELIAFVTSTPLKKYKLKSDGTTHYGIIITPEMYKTVKELGATTLIIEGEDGMYGVAYTEWQNILLEGVRRKIL